MIQHHGPVDTAVKGIKAAHGKLAVTHDIWIAATAICTMDIVQHLACKMAVAMGVAAPERLPQHFIQLDVRLQVPNHLAGAKTHRPLTVTSDITGAGHGNGIKVILISGHFGLIRFHQPQNVVLAVLQLQVGQWRVRETQFLIVKLVAVQLLVVNVHLFGILL